MADNFYKDPLGNTVNNHIIESISKFEYESISTPQGGSESNEHKAKKRESKQHDKKLG